MFQKNLNTKRFTPAPAQKESIWYVTIPGRFLPATYKYSLDARTYTISLVAKDIKDANKGGSGRRDVLHFRGSSPQELKERIEAAFSNAVFSTEHPKEADPVQQPTKRSAITRQPMPKRSPMRGKSCENNMDKETPMASTK